MKSEHLESKKLNYGEHFKQSMKFCGKSLKCSFFFFVHSFNPNACVHKGSDNVRELHSQLEC